MKEISTDEALAALRRGDPLEDCHVPARLELGTDEEFDVPVVLHSCLLDGLSASFCHFAQPFELHAVQVTDSVDFYAAYFLGGFLSTDCRFDGAVDFQHGGHNQNGTEFALERCHFAGATIFSGCWYEGPVTVRGCSFERGSDLLGHRGQPDQVRFDVDPLIEDNVGSLDLPGWDSADLPEELRESGVALRPRPWWRPW